MSRILDLIGFGLVGGTIYAFVGPIPQQDPLGWPIFWSCAGGAFIVILLKKKKRAE
jgi:hypothetical protein